jgi:uncharacterized protein with FMN-binding domain
LSSAAIIAVYAAGYARTRAAADAFNDADARRRPAPPATEKLDMPDAAPARPQPSVAAVSGAAAPIVPSAEPIAAPAAKAAATHSTEKAAASGAALPEAVVAAAASSITPLAPVPAAASVTTPAPEATAPVAAAAAPNAASATVVYKDGTYLGWGHSRHGDIQSFVIIEKGRIVHSGVEKCRTRWPCTLVDHLPAQVVKRQSPDVDFVSGATESGNAFYWGIVDALMKAKGDQTGEPKPSQQ